MTLKPEVNCAAQKRGNASALSVQQIASNQRISIHTFATLL